MKKNSSPSAAELYGGLKGMVDFGAVGHLMLQNLRRAVRSFFLRDACEDAPYSLFEERASLPPTEAQNGRGTAGTVLPLLLSQIPPRDSLAVSLPCFRCRRRRVGAEEKTEESLTHRQTSGETRESEARLGRPQDATVETDTDTARRRAGDCGVGEPTREDGGRTDEAHTGQGEEIEFNPRWGPIFAVETACLGPAAVWAASGHTRHFVDSLVRCTDTGQVFRTDSLAYREKLSNGSGKLFEVCHQSATRLQQVEAGNGSARRREGAEGDASRKMEDPPRGRDGGTKGEDLAPANGQVSSWRPLTEAPPELFPNLPSPVTGRIGALSTPFRRNLMLQTRLSRCSASAEENGREEGEQEREQQGEQTGEHAERGERGDGQTRSGRGKERDSANVADAEENAGIFRPETAQGMLIAYRNLLPPFLAPSLPFGIAQEGRAWRNELISSSRFLFRLREFRQFEIEYFIDAKKTDSLQVLNAWIYELARFFAAIGLPADLLSAAEQGRNDRPHYSSRCIDISFRFPFGDAELCGLALRGDYDLRSHQQAPFQAAVFPVVTNMPTLTAQAKEVHTGKA
ncbi:putative glycyl-tRNAsynthetase [Neospora caninum Liverpool]|uniref:Putative glycyl-tRNAsynthetase n=1 Tax=Neospora caninum (strain Liverpool) TaxID=572307 RepID=F0V9F3_NEOCL|nr:putative glycyl-tRNAsynthetase [Neospora caninum Liverpool]CBZ50378.1 putative glycyl-tRNAsynthetase [Neospora caninum Liverpool]|eukprot:XP_003880412.1 putative glycyl-tRNAsynthetase [Neospora caninum Liverpool]